MTRAEHDAIEQSLRDAASVSRGHFRYESGRHGDLWLDLDSLIIDARRMRDWAAAPAQRAASCRPEIVCGSFDHGRSGRYQPLLVRAAALRTILPLPQAGSRTQPSNCLASNSASSHHCSST
jgi:hypothetical protein